MEFLRATPFSMEPAAWQRANGQPQSVAKRSALKQRGGKQTGHEALKLQTPCFNAEFVAGIEVAKIRGMDKLRDKAVALTLPLALQELR
ncbi:hypothetical protein VTK56DRAFT_10249 [Thermocarpiscus australiensis]